MNDDKKKPFDATNLITAGTILLSVVGAAFKQNADSSTHANTIENQQAALTRTVTEVVTSVHELKNDFAAFKAKQKK